jgi:signal transduction histidine kinase
MNEEQLERVFDKFYRANANDASVHGLGLGMSIAKEIIEAHGGAIEVKSTQGEGTPTFISHYLICSEVWPPGQTTAD